MANASFNPLVGNCIAPFLDASKFPDDGGFIPGRFCAPIIGLHDNPTCCLPCPAADWTYPASLHTYNKVAEWLNVVGLVLMSFMLISYGVLPASQTRSHYLSICLVVAIMMIAVGFTIPLGANPQQCHNEITPNDMYSSTECAWSGAFIIAGGLAADTWIFIRALSMNLQICWDIVPGRKFFYISQLVGWGLPALLFTITITVTGVSFRFGSICHVNHDGSMGDFWAPLMALAGAAGILQLVTFGYCVNVYLKNLWTTDSAQSTNASSGGLPSYTNSLRTQTARAVWQRLKKVLWLQWRGICIVTIILADVLFFSIVFVHLDGLQAQVRKDWRRIEPWLACLTQHPDHKEVCLPVLDGWLVNESTVVAVLFLLSCAGLQAFLLLTRPTIFPAWCDLIKSKFISRQEFVSLDARPENMLHRPNQEIRYREGVPGQDTTFELQRPKQPTIITMDLDSKQMSSPISSPDEAYRSPLHHEREPTGVNRSGSQRGRFPPEYVGQVTPAPYSPPNAGSQMDYFSQSQRPQAAERRYNAPASSFSAPKSLSRQSSVQSGHSDYRETYGRGGLGLHPPSEEAESEEELPPRDMRRYR